MSAADLAVTWTPLVPWPVLAALGAAAAVVAALGAWRRARGWAVRGLAAAAVLAVLANPEVIRETREPLADIALVVVDASASQRLGERAEQRDAAVAALKERLRARPNTEVRVVRGGASTGPPVGGTRLMDAVERGLNGVPRSRLGAVFVVGDGQVHDVPEDGDALGIPAPIHLIQIGDPEAGDRRLIVEDAPRYGIVGESAEITLRVDESGVSDAADEARVTFRRGDGAQASRTVPVGESATVNIPVHRRGRIVVALEAAPGAREITERNNRAALTLNGVRDSLKVLLVSGMPHAGERAWRRLLKADPAVSLVHFTILRPPNKQTGTPIEELSLIAFPTRKLFQEKIDGFDLIVFDRYTWRGVLPRLYLNNVAQYVRDGGALLVASGPSFARGGSLARTPLRRVLLASPRGGVRDGAFRPERTEIGRRHPVTAGLAAGGDDGEAPSWGRWFRYIGADVAGGNTLMRAGPGAPLLTLDKRGEGRVAQLLSDQIWLWSRGYDGGGPQRPLMRRTAHWLMEEPKLAAEALRARASDRSLRVTRRSLSPLDDTTIRVSPPRGETREATLSRTRPGRHTADLAIEQVGLYEVRHGERRAFAAVGEPSPVEYRDVRPTADKLAPVLDATGGGAVVRAETGDPRVRRVAPSDRTHGPGWLGVVERGAHRVTGSTRLPLLPPVVALLLLAAAVGAAWYHEGR